MGLEEKERYEGFAAQFTYFEKELRKRGSTLQVPVTTKRYLFSSPIALNKISKRDIDIKFKTMRVNHILVFDL